MIYLSISPISLHIQVKNDEPTAAEHGLPDLCSKNHPGPGWKSC